MTRRKAFTLVELLVVIGIIAALVAILLPSLRKARETARVVSCASNLHQWGAILHMYYIDNKGQLPESFCFGGTGSVGRYPGSWYGSSNSLGAISAEMMSRYVPGVDLTNQRVAKIWICPSVAGSYDVDKYITGTWAANGFFESNYGYFGRSEKWPNALTQPLDITANALRADRVLMADHLFFWGPGPGWDYNHGKNGPSISDPAFAGFHDLGPPLITGINILNGDGSVRWKLREDLDPVRMQNFTLPANANLPRVKAVNPASSTFY
jgi:prepilin-type N-terminal cleavage/methylation domain-containing protein